MRETSIKIITPHPEAPSVGSRLSRPLTKIYTVLHFKLERGVLLFSSVPWSHFKGGDFLSKTPENWRRGWDSNPRYNFRHITV